MEDDEPNERPDDGAGGIHGAVQPEDAAAVVFARELGEEGVARGAPHALAETVEGAPRERERPGEGEADDELAHRRQRVARDHERFARPRAVGPAPREQLREVGGPFGHALDNADGGRGRPEGAREEERENGVDHLAGEVREEGDEAEHPHGPGDAPEGAAARGRGCPGPGGHAGRAGLIAPRPTSAAAVRSSRP